MSLVTFGFSGKLAGDHLSSANYATWCIGITLRENLPNIISSLTNEDPSLSVILDWMEQEVKGAFSASSNNPGEYVDRAKKRLLLIPEQHKEEISPGLTAVVRRAIKKLRWLEEAALQEHLDMLQRSGLLLAQSCAARYGEPDAQNYFAQRSPVDVHIFKAEKREPKIEYDRVNARILYHPGEPRQWLLEFLSLEFRFFHEYLSHICPRNDDEDRTFSEGYLFELERWTYIHLCQIRLLPGIVRKYWANAAFDDPRQVPLYVAARQAAEYYFTFSQDRFACVLFGFSTFSFSSKRPRLFSRVIDRLTDLLRGGQYRDSDLKVVCQLLEGSESLPTAMMIESLLKMIKRDELRISKPESQHEERAGYSKA